MFLARLPIPTDKLANGNATHAAGAFGMTTLHQRHRSGNDERINQQNIALVRQGDAEQIDRRPGT